MSEQASEYDTYLIQTTYSYMGTLEGGVGAVQEMRYISSSCSIVGGLAREMGAGQERNRVAV